AGVAMQWLNEKGKTVGRSHVLSKSGSGVPKTTLQPGTYYLKLSARWGVSSYRLSLAIAPRPRSAQKSLRSFSSRSFSDNQGDRFALKVLKLTNEYRRSFGLAPLRLNPVLSAIAQSHSQDMAQNDFFDHRGSNGSTVFDRFLQGGYAYHSGGENIAAGFDTPKSVVNAWIKSPGHRANLLTPFFQEMGVGFVHLPSDPGKIKLRYYWTQDFGVPET
ncbi:MAG: CAP domain-containing protein, partial [Cyanobacteriota bacterium]